MSDSLQCKLQDETLEIQLAEEVPLTLPEEIHALLQQYQGRIKTLALNMAGLARVDSRAIGLLALVASDETVQGLGLVFRNVQPRVDELIHATGLHEFVEIQTRAAPLEVVPEASVCPWGADAAKNCPVVGELQGQLDQARGELEAVRGQLIHSEKVSTLGQMAAGVAHEFNNLIAIMSGYTEIALQDMADKELVAEAMEVVQESCIRAKGVTEALLSFSRRKTPQKSVADISERLRLQAKLLKSDLLSHGVDLVLDLEPGARTCVDSHQLDQVFLNLLTNALHAMPDGGVLTLKTRVGPDRIDISISDTGKGIAEKDLQKIFTPFFTTKGAIGGSPVKGTGLGLSVSQGIVLNHKGTIEAKSQAGKGTTFIITLPVLEMHGMEEVVGTAGESAPGVHRPLTILVVDDEERIRGILEKHLTALGHMVFLAANGEEALSVCRECKPDVLFLDILMSGMNGADALLEIRRIHSDVAVAVITGQAGKALEAMLEMMKQAGNIELIRKPFSLQTIRDYLDRVLVRLVDTSPN